MENTQNKYRNWVFTWNASDKFNTLPNVTDLRAFLEEEMEHYVFQIEIGEKEGREHLQGAFRTPIRMRHQTLLKKFEMLDTYLIKYLTIDRMQGEWDEAFAYCTKEETRKQSTEFFCTNSLIKYAGKDIKVFQGNDENYFSWQISFLEEIFEEDKVTIKNPHDREIMWIQDSVGGCGKSKLTKWLCYSNSAIIKLPFGTAAQIRSACIAAGPKRVYIVDIPRTLGEDDSLLSIISSIEDIKNGHVISSFYGKMATLMMDPPHVVIFSNDQCPVGTMSKDRWKRYVIDPIAKDWIRAEYLLCG